MRVCSFKTGVFCPSVFSHNQITQAVTGERELNKPKWRLRGMIKNALNGEGKILSIRYSTQFILIFQCSLQAEAFSLSVPWRQLAALKA